MSESTLFGRVQDYGYAQCEPLEVIAMRHHVRIWKAPLTVDGNTLWAGAGTHDIGFGRDNRNNGVTHKIDPETDKERDYIAATLAESGMALKTIYMSAKHPITAANTATGSDFRCDGRTVILYLAAEGKDKSTGS